VISRRQKELLQTLWKHGRLSRWELHEQTGLTPNGVGSLVDVMLQAKLIRECPPEPGKMGRPRVPLEIEPCDRHLLGLALEPGRVEIIRLGLTGEAISTPVAEAVSAPSELVKTAAALLTQHLDPTTLAIGVTSTGFLDPIQKKILFSSAFPGRGVESLESIFDAAGDTPPVLGNDMHALVARWLLTHRAEQQQDVLLVWFTDGRLGSALLIEGQPNHGCTSGANELGHTRFPGIDTARCFCGQVGCLERIVSSDFLRRQSDATGDAKSSELAHRIAEFTTVEADPPLGRMIDLLAHSLSNAVIFLRLHRLVLVSPYTRHAAFSQALQEQTRALVLPDLADRVEINLWEQPSAGSAENAGWLALADLLYGGWDAMGRHSPAITPASASGVETV
jgi:predicted NBD/HSP70 family sugar kinase